MECSRVLLHQLLQDAGGDRVEPPAGRAWAAARCTAGSRPPRSAARRDSRPVRSAAAGRDEARAVPGAHHRAARRASTAQCHAALSGNVVPRATRVASVSSAPTCSASARRPTRWCATRRSQAARPRSTSPTAGCRRGFGTPSSWSSGTPGFSGSSSIRGRIFGRCCTAWTRASRAGGARRASSCSIRCDPLSPATSDSPAAGWAPS